MIADALARWHRLLGDDVFFLTGTDEHGQKVQRAAEALGKTPKEFVDAQALHFKAMCSAVNSSHSRFIRTTDSDHIEVAKTIFQKVLDNGDIYLGTYEGMYCTGCEAFYLERDAPGNECPLHKKALERVKEPSYFFKLSKYQNAIIKHIKESGFIQPDGRRQEILNRLSEPLRDLSVSRTTFSWGIPLPNDSTHVIYVWFDALLNYISGIGYPGPQFKKYWPATHIVGKDILWFHAVIWPAILLSAGIPLPKLIFAHGFINIGGEKLSKSRGVIADPIKLINDYSADSARYFFLSQIPTGQDGDFSEEALVARSNADLADTLGNLLQRTTVLIHKNFEGKWPAPAEFTQADKVLIEKTNLRQKLQDYFDAFELNRAAELIWDLIRFLNKYINEQAPWKSTDRKRIGTVLYCVAESLRISSVLVSPFIPESASKIATQLGQPTPTRISDAVFRTTTTGTCAKASILFRKMDVAKINDPFGALNLKVGVITEVKPHPNADKLYVVTVNLGEEQRTLCAGIKQWYAPEQLVGKHIVIITNLKAAKLRGVESKGMLLAAEKEGTVRVLEAPPSPPGTPVTIAGIPQGTNQITIDDFAKVTITTAGGKAVCDGRELGTPQGLVTVELGDGATVR